ncbi:hypothetical protein LguiA_033568 [Lonicera macranthoides]
MACNNTQYWLLSVLSILLTSVVVSSRGESEAKTLLKFKNSLSNNTALNGWDESISMCSGDTVKANWNGVICLDGKFFGLRLEGMGLSGRIDTDILAELPFLGAISLMNNNFEGPMPNINKLGGLRGFFISNNKFSGEIPSDAFSGTRSLKRVYLSNNEFKGKIPKSLGNLPKLAEVHLEGNNFEGPIPPGLSKQNSSSFTGNLNLCGKPLKPCPPSRKRNIPKLAVIVIASVGFALLAIIAAYFFFRRSQSSKHKNAKSIEEDLHITGEASKADPTDDNDYHHYNNYDKKKKKKGRSEKAGKLYFVRNDRERFELQDLLRASAEVLGSGCFGSSYKAVLLSGGPALVVKRYKQMGNVGKEDFYVHMRKLGALSHPNLLPLVAFYYKKEEKLLISDFAHNGSLASHLHGKQSPNQPGLDWPTRLKVVKGVAKGLSYLNKELKLLVPHGHLKSTNVLLDNNYEPLVADYGLLPVVNKEHAQQLMAAYKSPDFTQNNLINNKTDVWCLGILILEILTGKFPANYLTQGKGNNVDLASWVKSVVREEWTGEVFDKEIKGREKGEGEMLKLLKIGMCCCEWDAEKRWDLEHAISKIQDLKERENIDEDENEDGSFYSSSSIATMIEGDFSFSVTK